MAVPTSRSPTSMVASSFWGSLRRWSAILARWLWLWANARSLVSLKAKKPISAVEITAERTISPNRIAISIALPGLGTGHVRGRPDTGNQNVTSGNGTGAAHRRKAKIDVEGVIGR